MQSCTATIAGQRCYRCSPGKQRTAKSLTDQHSEWWSVGSPRGRNSEWDSPSGGFLIPQH